MNEEHLAILDRGLEVWNEWRAENPEILPDLSKADLSGAYLRKAHFGKADLGKANLIDADLSGACLNGADLRNAALTDAILLGADLRGADLRGAVLVGTDLTAADLDRANLSRTALAYVHLSGASLYETDLARAATYRVDFVNVDLSHVKGLESIRHLAPSSIGIDTLYRSKGNIAEAFLSGAGVPQQMIENARSLFAEPISYYSCFISYAGEDKDFCDRLFDDLKGEGVRVWYFPETAKWGEEVWGEIDRGIQLYDKLVVICSRHSLQSEAVLKEIDLALNREQGEQKTVLFPVRLDDYIFEEWEHPHKQSVLDKVVGDFRGWDFDHARYQTQFERLLGALQQ